MICISIAVMKKTKEGVPCKTCGGTERYISNSGCVSCYRERSKRWRKNNRELYNEYQRNYTMPYRRSRDISKATPPWANLAEIAFIYKECERLAEEMKMPFVVDHVIPLRGKKVCGLHVEYNLRVTSIGLNDIKASKFDSEHESEAMMRRLKGVEY